MSESAFKAKDRYGAETEFEMEDLDEVRERDADILYRKAYGLALKEGLIPRESMRKLLRDHGIWDEEHEKEFRERIAKVGSLEAQLEITNNKGNSEECIKIAGDLAKARRIMWNLMLIQSSAFSNSCEAYAETIRMEAQLASSIVIKATKQRYWKSYSDYVMERDTNETSEVPLKAMEIVSEKMSVAQLAITENNPEQKWIKQFKLDTEEARKSATKELKRRAKHGSSHKVAARSAKPKTNRKKASYKRVAKKPR